MIDQECLLASLRDQGLPPDAVNTLRGLFRTPPANRPDILEVLTALPPSATPPAQGATPQDIAWGIELLRNMLASGDAPLACLWLALHFKAMLCLRDRWGQPGRKAPPLSPFVYAMQ